MKLIIVVNVDWFFLSHRLPIALEAIRRGWEVLLVCSDTGRFEEIKSNEITPINLEVDRSGKNIFKERKVIRQLESIYKEHKPDVVHHVTMKIAIYGSLAAKKAGISKVVNAISGLGFSFTAGRKSITQRIILGLMNRAFKKRGQTFIFQNPDDEAMFQKLGLGEGNNSIIIKGSGVNLDQFLETPLPSNEKVRFVLTARMLKDKGVGEFVSAIEFSEKERPGRAEYHLVGGIDSDNPAGYSEQELKQLIQDTPVQWKGFQSDILKVLQDADVVVLPSYREGLPKSLIEAAAVGRPIITTDAVGCRECVDHEVNGFLVPVGDSQLMAEYIVRFIDEADLRIKMGKASREKAEREFSIESVIEKTFKAYL